MKLNWYGTMSAGEGYSSSSEKLVLALEELGIDIRLVSFFDTPSAKLSSEALKIKSKPFVMGDIGICYGFPNAFTSIMNPIKIGFTMFETDKIPNGKNRWAGETGNAIDIINQMNALIVPSTHNKELFEKEGVKIPIYVVPLGIADNYKYFERFKLRTFTFLWVGTFTKRKDPEMVVRAFIDLFGDDPSVKLILKTQGGSTEAVMLPKNIKIIDEYYSESKMNELYRMADCFVFPSKGEGFGLPPLEAMATGCPTICAYNTGMKDFVNDKVCYGLYKQKLEPAPSFQDDWGDIGNWSVSDIEELKTKMMLVYSNWERALQKAKRGSVFVRQNYNYNNSALKLLEVIEEINDNIRKT